MFTLKNLLHYTILFILQAYYQGLSIATPHSPLNDINPTQSSITISSDYINLTLVQNQNIQLELLQHQNIFQHFRIVQVNETNKIFSPQTL